MRLLSEISILLGMFSGERFSYARALVDPGLRYSIILRDIAEDLRCFEKPDDLVEEIIKIKDSILKIKGLCRIDQGVLNGFIISIPVILYVAEIISGEKNYESYIGRDIINAWALYIDPLKGLVISRFGRRITSLR